MSTLTPEAFVFLPELLAQVRLSRSNILDQVARGEFPCPVRLSTRRVAWRTEDIEAWLKSRPSVVPAGAAVADAEVL